MHDESVGTITNMMDIRAVLQELGFDRKEISIYLATLELGMAPASLIARRAGLKRPTVYVVLKRLRKKGMTDCFLKGNVQFYAVMAPARLCEKYERCLRDFKEALPHLTSLQGHPLRKPRMHLAEGKSNIQRIYRELLAGSGELLYGMLPAHAARLFSSAWLRSFSEACAVRKILVRALAPEEQKTREWFAGSAAKNLTLRTLPLESFPFAHEILIHRDTVAMICPEEGHALIIESREIAETQRALFEIAWRNASPLAVEQRGQPSAMLRSR